MFYFEKPKIEIADISEDNKYGRFVVEPLERGYGITLGNSLRRIMLSSLPGAAVSHVKIDGVVHEFSAIPGVKEDVTEIIMNIKSLAIKNTSLTNEPKLAYIEYEGEGVVTATGDVIQVREYSDFVGLDQPQTVVSSSPNHPEWTGYIYKEQRTYDAEGQLIKAVRSSVSDGKETPTQLETWTYEGNFLTEYVKSSYDALGQVKPIFKTSYLSCKEW